MTDTPSDDYDDVVDDDDDNDDNNEVDDGDEYEDDVDDGDEDDANTIPAATARDVLEYVVRCVVSDPDSVANEVDDSRRTVALNVTVAPDDMGRVIGRRGRIANSIRSVVRAAAARDNTTVEVEFVD
jgi:predicted RNA-binding protein YlqC (UPF0109 family)